MRKMKNSGVDWIGEIPTNWMLNPVKLFFRNQKKIVGDKADEYDRLALTLNGVIKRSKDDNEGLQPEKFEGYQILQENELVFKLIDLENVKTSRVGLSPYNGLVSPAYIVLSNNNKDNRYYYYWFMFMYYNEVFNNLGGAGVRSALNAKDVLSLPIPDIDSVLRCHIADYLDDKCSKIDNIIEKQQQVIEKLKEYKLSVITEAVTKGLDPNAEMKDSGIKWIGMIPEKWGTTKLGRVSTIRSGITLGRKIPENTKLIERPYLRVANVQNGFVDTSNVTVLEVTEDEDKKYRLCNGDVLMTEGGDRDKLGRGCVWNASIEPCLHQNHIFALNTNPKFLNQFYFAYVTASKVGRVYFDMTAIKTTNLACTSASKVSSFRIPLPPLREQQIIVDYLDKKCLAIETAISKKQAVIDKLAEYKKSLIYEVVTGKKEV